MSDTELIDAPDVAESFPLPGMPGEMRLPSGGWAVLRPFDQLTGRDVRVIRAALNSEGTGDILGGAFAKGIAAVVVEWQIPNRHQLELPIKGAAVLDRLPADDLMALEDAVRGFVLRILGKEEKKAGEADPS